MESSSLVKDYNPVTPAAFARGYIVYCSFGHPHLVCRPEHIPDDPMLPHPIYAFRSGRVFAEQFLHDLDPWRNSQFIISTLFDYLHITSFSSGYKPVTSQLNEVAEALVDERLVMFELWDIAEHPNVVKQQLQKSDKTRSSDAAGSSAPKRSSGADLASPEKKTPAPSSTSSAPVVTGAGKKTDTSKASEPQASEASAKKAPAQKKAPPQSMEECVQRLADAKARLQQEGYKPKYSSDELQAMAAKAEVPKDRFIVRFSPAPKDDSSPIGHKRDSGRHPLWMSTFDMLENADTDPAVIADVFGTKYDPNKDYVLYIIDRGENYQQDGSDVFVPTFENMASKLKEEFAGQLDPATIDKVMTPEYAEEFRKHWDEFGAHLESQDKHWRMCFEEDEALEFADEHFEDPQQVDEFHTRQVILSEIGAWEIFTGDGLTETYSSPGTPGALEILEIQNSPDSASDLIESGKLYKLEC